MRSMNRREFLLNLGVGSAAAAWGLPALVAVRPASAAEASNRPPNIILCMADDQGWGEVGYNDKAARVRPHIKTPALDAMASAGLRFNRFYSAQSCCSPTRGSVLTGRHPHRYACWGPGVVLRNQEKTVAQALRATGYATGHFGKWHLNGVSGPGKPIGADDPHSPSAFGFDTWFSVSNYFELDWTFSRNGQSVQTTGDGSDAIVAEALKFIEDSARRKKRFFALVWFGSPHVPIKPLPAYHQQADGDAYGGEIYGIDHAMGTLRGELHRLGLAEDTLVWYCSDNGAHDQVGTGGLRGKKGQIWEGGVRVPGIIEWPARIPKPAVTDVPAVTSDICPTLLELAGVPVDTMLKPQDGLSLVGLLDGKMSRRSKPIGFWSQGRVKGMDDGHAALTSDRYKLHKLGKGKWELYDLVADPSESKDLAGAKGDVVASMKAELEAWQKSVLNSTAGKDYPTG